MPTEILASVGSFFPGKPWAELTHDQQIKTVHLLDRLVAGDLDFVENYITQRGGRSMPPWLKESLLESIAIERKFSNPFGPR